MELLIDVSDKDLLELGKDTILKEVHETLRWLKIKKSFRQLSKELQALDLQDYQHQLEQIRETSWQEYRKDLPL